MRWRCLVASGLLGSALMTSVPVPSGAAACVVYRHEIVFDADSEVKMIVDSGKDCRILFPIGDKTRVDSNEFTAHPHHGGARVHGTSGAYYRSFPGYRGPDRFAFSICGMDDGKAACADVRVNVDVR
jgi:hypothetical protein